MDFDPRWSDYPRERDDYGLRAEALAKAGRELSQASREGLSNPREREPLDEVGRKAVEAAAIEREGDLYEKVVELYKSASFYANRDPKLAAQINRLPLLPHFARFERVREMFPAEARRILDSKK